MGTHAVNLIQSPKPLALLHFDFPKFPNSSHLYHSHLSLFHSSNPSSKSTALSLSSLSLSLSLSLSSYAVLPKASSTAGKLDEESETTSSGLHGKNDLLIVGPGVLGRLVAQQWRQEYPGCQVYGQTATSDHHDELVEIEIIPSVKGTKLPRQFSYVIFCAPPSKSLDYAADVREAISSWNGEGSFVFTSSSAPYDCTDNGYCDEDTPVVPLGRSPRTDVLLKAEDAVLEYGGCVLRLAGLYKADRGAHTYWLNQETSELRPDHVVNLIHYEVMCSLLNNYCFFRKVHVINRCYLSFMMITLDAFKVCYEFSHLDILVASGISALQDLHFTFGVLV
ncbi:hypothetical protein RND81_12G057900 [Saponaria officinalis]|uniref:Uncharacterized protein n=1 Tax=Saponaria officinalis TaxID=3572 RepID=A0AAW1H3N1_SAPOF